MLEQADKDDNIEVYFSDAVHLIYGGYTGYCWCINRVQVKSAYGRQRVNCLGFLDSKTNQIITEINDSYINHESVINGLRKLRKINGDKVIYVILDNARYQNCKAVKEEAEGLKIILIFLPAYSPNLNLIERFWKFLRKELLENKYIETFKEYMASISEFISKAHINSKEKLNSLLTHNFEILGE